MTVADPCAPTASAYPNAAPNAGAAGQGFRSRALGGYVVALLANQALYLGECRLMVQYSTAVLRAAGGGLAPSLITDLHALAGKAYARMGDSGLAREHLRISEATAARLDFAGGPAE